MRIDVRLGWPDQVVCSKFIFLGIHSDSSASRLHCKRLECPEVAVNMHHDLWPAELAFANCRSSRRLDCYLYEQSWNGPLPRQPFALCSNVAIEMGTTQRTSKIRCQFTLCDDNKSFECKHMKNNINNNLILSTLEKEPLLMQELNLVP